LGGVVATSLAELEAECQQVEELLELSQKVYEQGQESKFNKLCEVLEDKKYRDEKILIFTEHRDTLTYLVRQLEGMGYTGQVVQIHGGMDYLQREEIVATFRRPVADGGARYLVATDAAGEGINLQVCWLMINYDIPWNPARLEQRMGRIHRYGQKHDVVIVNLVAGKTREGRVLRILLEKMERIRRELRSDKVFDVVGRLFEGVSLRAYLEQAVTEEGADQAEQFIEGHLTPEQVRALQERERRLYGDGGDVRRNLPRLQESLELETYRRLLPGYVRRFFERAAPLVDIGFDGNLEAAFSLRPLRPGALDPLWPVMEAYGSERLNRLTFNRPDNDDAPVVFLHPGEPLFDRFCAYVTGRFSRQALRGGVFVDPTARQPYLFHLAEVTVLRQANPGVEVFAHEETLETRLVGLRQEADGKIEICPLETLLLLKGGEGLPPEALSLAAAARDRLSVVHAFLMSEVVQPLVEARRQAILANLPESEQFLKRGYAYQEAELAAARSRYRQKAESGDPRARQELTRVRERQRILATQQEAALAGIRREPDLVAPGEIRFLAHALVVPSSDPRDIQRRDEAVEAIAMQVAVAYEQAAGANVRNVSTPELARGVGLGDKPGFDLLSYRPDSEIRLIEVKGRAGVGDVIISDNEWSSACNHREKFWLYVVFDCASTHPRLIRIQNPWSKLLAKAKAYTLDQATILNSGE